VKIYPEDNVKRTITSTDIYVAAHINGDCFIYGGDEPVLNDDGFYQGFVLAFIGPSGLYNLDPGSCVRLYFETRVKKDQFVTTK